MSVELNNLRNDLTALAKELDLTLSLLYRLRKEFLIKQNSSFTKKGKVIFIVVL